MTYSRKLMQSKPSLVLWGDKDPFAASTFAETFGAQEVHHFPTYSHWLPLESPTAYAERVIPWLSRTAAT
jgi:pimeloyl-ACP methyl ester carboxylesterase